MSAPQNLLCGLPQRCYRGVKNVRENIFGRVPHFCPGMSRGPSRVFPRLCATTTPWSQVRKNEIEKNEVRKFLRSNFFGDRKILRSKKIEVKFSRSKNFRLRFFFDFDFFYLNVFRSHFFRTSFFRSIFFGRVAKVQWSRRGREHT